MKNYVGQKYGRLLIKKQFLKQFKNYKRSHVLAQCDCDCGVLKEYRLDHLKTGNTKSCGCYNKEKAKERLTTHGMNGTSIYHTWTQMIQRCSNPKDSHYKNYGGRGIKVCDSWLKFENFYEDMGDKPLGLQLDRIDNTKGYYKENCHWTTLRKNNQNTRVSKYWFINGKKYNSRTEAAYFLGVSHVTIKRWCDGYFSRGVSYAPKPGCHSELKYSKES